jgi:TolA-binding protein
MLFHRQWLLIFFALVLGGGQIHAASSEDRAFAAATAAFQDGIYDRAEAQFVQFIQHFPKSGRVPSAVLSLSQAQFKQGKYAAAAKTLTVGAAGAGALADQFAYWLGEAQFAQGDFTNAAATLAALPKNYPDSPLRLTAVVEAAAAYAQFSDWGRHDALLEATNGVFARAAQADPDNALVSNGRLSLAQSRLARGDFATAGKFLEALNPQSLAPEQAWSRLNLLYQVKAGLNDLPAALAVATNLMQSAKDSVQVAESVALRAAVLEKMNLPDAAAEVWTNNLAGSAPVERQREAVLKIAALAAAQNNLTNAVGSLEKFLAQFPHSSVSELVLVTLGELRLKEFLATASAAQLAAAQTNFDQFINGASTNSSLIGKACLDRGWCNWNAAMAASAAGDAKLAAQRIASSLVDFRAAAQRPLTAEDRAVAEFKAGDAMFALTNYVGATNNYQAVLDDYADIPAVAEALGDRALYQILRADIELGDTNGAAAAMAKLLEKFPASELADNSQLLLGEAFSDFHLPEKARAVLLPFARHYPDSPLLPQVELALARTFERETNWTAAVTNYQAWLQNHPTNELFPQVQFALAHASDQAGREAEAYQWFTDLTARFPTNDLAPLAQWWVADHFYRAGNFVGAETNYELIFQTPAWKDSTNLFFQAQLMAGRAAANRQGFSDAADYLTKLVSDTNCPAPLKTEAMFAYGGVLMQWVPSDTNRLFLNYERATNVFAKLIQDNATNELGAVAWNEFGDCCLQLGAFDTATNAYAQAVAARAAGETVRSRAKVGLGKALEKKAELAESDARLALLTQARDQYQDVLDVYRVGDLTDAIWVKEAGLQELALLPRTGVRDVDQFFTDLERLLPPLKDALEKKKAALKN